MGGFLIYCTIERQPFTTIIVKRTIGLIEKFCDFLQDFWGGNFFLKRNYIGVTLCGKSIALISEA